MKYLIAVQFTFIVCFATYVSNSILSIKFESPGPSVIMKFLKLSPEEFLKKCIYIEVFDEIDSEGYLATQMAYALANVIVSRAKKLKKIDENHWNELIDSQCLNSAGVKGDIADIVYQMNKCLIEDRPLIGIRRTLFIATLFKEYCAAVLKLAKERYAAGKD
ncbi:uncharacterized protein LOC117169597 [Belonocnema kinseyi]|uniref:uncharacterized protein LOC117169597 n=1 Tax=Belonocnema kinseyi TaxID=2817044 RepID=UPI00143D9905|nr:uncharacterized protein LOC117169597 [Belonocnema kinseyi]